MARVKLNSKSIFWVISGGSILEINERNEDWTKLSEYMSL